MPVAGTGTAWPRPWPPEPGSPRRCSPIPPVAGALRVPAGFASQLPSPALQPRPRPIPRLLWRPARPWALAHPVLSPAVRGYLATQVPRPRHATAARGRSACARGRASSAGPARPVGGPAGPVTARHRRRLGRHAGARRDRRARAHQPAQRRRMVCRGVAVQQRRRGHPGGFRRPRPDDDHPRHPRRPAYRRRPGVLAARAAEAYAYVAKLPGLHVASAYGWATSDAQQRAPFVGASGRTVGDDAGAGPVRRRRAARGARHPGEHRRALRRARAAGLPRGPGVALGRDQRALRARPASRRAARPAAAAGHHAVDLPRLGGCRAVAARRDHVRRLDAGGPVGARAVRRAVDLRPERRDHARARCGSGLLAVHHLPLPRAGRERRVPGCRAHLRAADVRAHRAGLRRDRRAGDLHACSSSTCR